MMKQQSVFIKTIFLFVVCAFNLIVAQNYDEAFTIFIDLDDFHLTQADSHEFLDHQEIGEHNNVILHLTEDQVKYHMNKHDTHDCHHPQEIHEVVSFIQENMYTTTKPNSVDQAIDQAIDKAFGSNYAMTSMQANIQPAPVSQVAPVSQQPASVAQNQLSDEEEAVNRFREAYHAYSSFSHAFQGIDSSSTSSSSSSPNKAQTNPISSIFNSLIDENDKKMFGLFQNQLTNPKTISDYIAPAIQGAFSDVIGHAYDNTLPNENANNNHRRHHHHHRRHHDDEEEAVEQEQEQQEQQQVVQPQAVQPQVVQPQAVQPQVVQPQVVQQQQVLSNQEREVIRNLVSIVLDKKDEGVLSHEIQEIANQVKSENNIKSQKSPSSSRPSAPLMTSEKIEKPFQLTDNIPESVYAKENVPFSEPQTKTKHVAKRILIPRMEEPGPVIGGGSKPLHIQLPPMDDDIKAVGNTRPSAPAQVQIQSSSSITAAAETQASSSKSSTMASANDEALSAPEVVIF